MLHHNDIIQQHIPESPLRTVGDAGRGRSRTINGIRAADKSWN